MEQANPFADFGRIVFGERFFGRDRELRLINQRVLEAEFAGNIALVGEPRIGKSSIAYQAVMRNREDLRQRRIIPVWLNVATCTSGWEIFQRLASKIGDELIELGFLTPRANESLTSIRRATGLDGETQTILLSFFERFRASGVRILCVLDEFDHARLLFAGDKVGFQLLREICTNPDCNVAFITTSRREIVEIEKQSGVISTLAGAFMKIYVRPFVAAEVAEFFNCLKGCCIEVDSNDQELALEYSGGHPLFLATMGFHIFNSRSEDLPVSIETICETVASAFIEQYERLVELMIEDGTFTKLLQILFGPVFDIRPADVERLLGYGVIKKSDVNYLAYSSHFHGFLRLMAREADIWPLWRDTETGLRRVVGMYLIEKYGTDWLPGFQKAKPKMSESAGGWVRARESEEKKYGDRASTDLLDYTYPSDLFAIMASDWAWFGKLFPGQSTNWERPFQVLAKVRTPLAHNRANNLHQGVIDEATGVCKQVLERLRVFSETKEA